MNFNPWHHVEIGKDQPEVVNSIIEISKGSKTKYELDKKSGMLKLDRVLFSSVFYPANYGFIPKTLGEDHDPLDIVVLSQCAIVPMCMVRARVVGVMRMIDHGEGDDKIIAVADDDMSMSTINDIDDLSKHFNSELKHFFEEYKALEKKTVLVEDFQDAETARKIINESIVNYQKTFGVAQEVKPVPVIS
ncbi:inorganic diphosphatase [Prosthecochloris sp. N3]|uniref:Inorganic pyrophosphatase n=1 Tax=Prosthecochloris ethylica TaxID=2743976 RepID=A0ABR9XP69_9CHLB|nr:MULTISPECIES: inorganic diphosphatase [Prosthecochloris]MEC9486261.1 inorganic diphosphatase [Prosthecochloris sp.]MBF0586120.1 inorganic diphosphatase [Prosthecochloris ethylica]MBF0635826.1 inorganic diphosphatase [Prosthecochloris ethylica]NUK47498.1 inorganic diphosphatase [Prosthecochloris ethylica]RNA65040.1 inorganic diphosphatase [Prosthecochloris sp. ZM_2]